MPPTLLTFLYHEVTDDPAAAGFQRASALPYKHTWAEFSANLDAIALSGRVPILLHRGVPTTGTHLVLTFDDGGASALAVADCLERREWRAHFLITTGMIGRRCFVTPSDVRELDKRGHVVGVHSHTHPDVFRALAPNDLLREWTTSRDCLEQIIGAAVTVASVPGGDSSVAVERAAARAGISVLFTSEPSRHPWVNAGVTCIGRVCPKTGTPIDRVARLARGQDWTRALAIRRAGAVFRRIPGYTRVIGWWAGREMPSPAGD